MRYLITPAILVLVALGMCPAEGRDVEIDFEFLKVGLKRKAVIELLGPPSAQSKSQSLFVGHRKLVWITPSGARYATFFVHDRLWRWKKCTPGLKGC